MLGSSDSLDDRGSPADSDRGFSATSKQSADSGLGEDNGDVITEFSEEDKIKEVEKDFKTADGLGEFVFVLSIGAQHHPDP